MNNDEYKKDELNDENNLGSDRYDDIDNELADNPTKRVPVCLCLDTSISMSGEPIEQLNNGVESFYKAINDDEIAKQAADVCIITFGGSVDCVQDFTGIADEMPPRFSAGGETPMGGAVEMAMDLLEERKKEYKDNGTEYFQPWLVLITDGQPTDEYKCAAQKTSDLANNKKLTIFPIGVEGCNMDILKKFSPKRPPIKLIGLNFVEFFQWLSQSVVVTYHSKEDEMTTKLPKTDEWGEL